MSNTDKNINRREFIKKMGIGTAAVGATALTGYGSNNNPVTGRVSVQGEIPTDKMTYRINPTSGDRVSLLGYGCMRWPTIPGSDDYDQETVNRLVDYAIEHGVNYFDTAPTYCRGLSEAITGIALKRHPRDKFFIATKLSNTSPALFGREASMNMYHSSFKNLQVDYIDYLLLHSLGGGGNGVQNFEERFIQNGMLEFLLKEREAGRIRNLGFSFHGHSDTFDYLLSLHDKYHWDFVQIQLNYMDWRHAEEVNARNTNGEYLYTELEKLGIPAIVMEPLLGGRLSNVHDHIATSLKEREPELSVASWAFRFAGSCPNVMTVLSGMTYLEHLQDNLRSFSPLVPLTDEERDFLEEVAQMLLRYPTIPCNDCNYCMPCPYGLDIPGIFVHYNKCINEGNMPSSSQDPAYRKERRAFLVGYDRSVPRLRQADHCIACHRCARHCPQNIDIPSELHRINTFVESLKQGLEF